MSASVPQPTVPTRLVRPAHGRGPAVAVHDFGGTGQPAILSHATGMHGLVWRPLAERLDRSAFHALSLDHRFHGDSDAPLGEARLGESAVAAGVPLGDALVEAAFDWRRFGDDILTVVEAFGWSRPVGVGHSFGGAAMLLAEEARPGTFAALVLFEPVVVPIDPPLGRDRDNWLAAGARRRRAVFASRAEAYQAYAAKAPFDRWSEDALAAYVDHGFADQPDGTVRLKCRPEHEALVYEMATAHPAFGGLARVTCPVLVLAGAESEFATIDDRVARLTAALPNGRRQVLPHVAHFGPMEQPHAVASAISDFLSRLQ